MYNKSPSYCQTIEISYSIKNAKILIIKKNIITWLAPL